MDAITLYYAKELYNKGMTISNLKSMKHNNIKDFTIGKIIHGDLAPIQL